MYIFWNILLNVWIIFLFIYIKMYFIYIIYIIYIRYIFFFLLDLLWFIIYIF